MRFLFGLFAFLTLSAAAEASDFSIRCTAIQDAAAIVGYSHGYGCVASTGEKLELYAISIGASIDTGEGFPEPVLECTGILKAGKNVLYGIKAGAGAMYGKGYANWKNRETSCVLSGTTYPMGFQLGFSRLVIVRQP